MSAAATRASGGREPVGEVNRAAQAMVEEVYGRRVWERLGDSARAAFRRYAAAALLAARSGGGEDDLELRAWEHALSGDLDAWLNTAHDHREAAVRAAAGTAIAALAALRVAMDELARAQDRAGAVL